MPTLKLTKRSVDALPAPPGCDYYVWDVSPKGFGVRVTERQGVVRKAYLLGYRPAGSRQFRRVTLGSSGAMTVDQARKRAMQELVAVAAGGDPLRARRAARAEQTVRELGEAFLDDVAAHRKARTAAEYARLWRKHVLIADANPRLAGER